jgi:hypothetical protein
VSFLGIAATIAGLAMMTTKAIAIKISCIERAPKLEMQQCHTVRDAADADRGTKKGNLAGAVCR